MALDNIQCVFELNTDQYLKSVNKIADRIKVATWFYLFIRYSKSFLMTERLKRLTCNKK